MLQIDSISKLAMTLDDVCALDPTRLSNPQSFREFAEGIELNADFLTNDRWSQMSQMQMSSPAAPFGIVMHEMLPTAYHAAWLESLGGHIGIRITGIGDYTLVALNSRVVTLSGLPTDFVSGVEMVDIEIAPDIFMAFCRGLLLDVADDVLEGEDEYEDREISDVELMLHGMPSGGRYIPPDPDPDPERDGYDITVRLEVDAAAADPNNNIQVLLKGRGVYSGEQLSIVHINTGNTMGLDGSVFRGDKVSVLTGDFDNDGNEDILRHEFAADWNYDNYATIQVWLNDGGGSFSKGTVDSQGNSIGLDGGHFNGSKCLVKVADFNDDGYEDILRHEFSADWNSDNNNTIQVWLNDGDGSFSLGPVDSAGNTLGLNGTFTRDGLAISNFNGQYSSASITDINGDGIPDILHHRKEFIESHDNTYHYITSYFGDGDGSFTKGPGFSGQGLRDHLYIRGLGTGRNEELSVAVGDLNGDGNADLLVSSTLDVYNGSNQKVYTYIGNGDGTFGTGSLTRYRRSPNEWYEVETLTEDNYPRVCGADACGANFSSPCASYTVTSASCGAAAGGCGADYSGIAGWACGAAASGCGANFSLTGASACAVAGSACAANFSLTGSAACVAAVSGCGARAAVTFAAACGAAASACGAAVSATGLSACGAAASACGAQASLTGIFGCGANAAACGANASITYIGGCGANASACAAAASVGILGGCGANAGVCAADVSYAPCGGYAVACVVDLGWGVDAGACLVNLLPILPSC